MSCCKDNLLMYLVSPTDIESTIQSLSKHLNFQKEQSELAIQYSLKHGKCLIYEGSRDDINAKAVCFAKDMISIKVESKSIK